MADKMTFMAKWLEDIRADENLDISEQELAYITYAAVIYGISSEKLNIGETFGNEFRFLNMAMPNIYGQIDNIQSYNPNRKSEYDAEAIKELRLAGKTARQICEELGYDVDKANSLTSNRGWREAGQILRQKCTDMEKPVQKSVQNVQKSGKSVQKQKEQICTEMDKSVQNENRSVQKSVQKVDNVFNF